MTLRACVRCAVVHYDSPFDIRSSGVCFTCEAPTAPELAEQWAEMRYYAEEDEIDQAAWATAVRLYPQLPDLVDAAYAKLVQAETGAHSVEALRAAIAAANPEWDREEKGHAA